VSAERIDEVVLRAYHEAGHASAAIALDQQAECAYLRFVTTRYKRDDAEALRRHAIVAFAGPMAELRLCAYSDAECADLWVTDWRDDLGNALRYLDACDGGLCAPILRTARRLVRRNWRTIERVAAALIECGELSGDAVDEVIGGDRLTGDEIDRLIAHISGEC
jgi:hypothetical protein